MAFSQQSKLSLLATLCRSSCEPTRLRHLRLAEELEGAGYYIVAESLANTLKHADASRVEVTLARSIGQLLITISDDGNGFEQPPLGNGLANLRASGGPRWGARSRKYSRSRNHSFSQPHGGFGRRGDMIPDVSVVVAEDHYLVREGIRRALEDTGDIEVVATVGTTVELVDAVSREAPDVIVADIRMPPGHQTEGIDAALSIRRARPTLGVVVLSQYADAAYAMELLRDGNEGLAYLLKERVGRPEQLIEAVREVARGGSVIDPNVVATLVRQNRKRSTSPLSGLTERGNGGP